MQVRWFFKALKSGQGPSASIRKDGSIREYKCFEKNVRRFLHFLLIACRS